MKALFKQSKIDLIYVNGNGESIYYVLDESDSTNIFTMGMNRILCSDMTIRFKDEKLDNISFYKRPEARFIPPHELTPEVQKLDGFEWRGTDRPELIDLLTDVVVSPTTPEKTDKIIPKEEINLEKKSKTKAETLKSLKGEGE